MSFLDRLAARTVTSGPLRSIEDPRFVALVATVAFAGSTVANLLSGLGALSQGEAAWWAYVASAISVAVGWSVYSVTGRLGVGTLIAITGNLASTTVIHVLLGGFAGSGGIAMWGITLAVVAALVVGRWAAVAVGGVVVLQAIVLGFFEETLRASRLPPDPGLSTQNFVSTVVGNVLVTVPLIVFLLSRIGFERRRAERLLLNVLPSEVAAELKEHGRTTARQYDSVSVLFADIVGFTPMSADMEAQQMVDRLNEVFTHFDGLTERFGAEKIRTIGDNYMVAAGLPVPRDDHAACLADMALAMQDYAAASPFRFRIGIHSGPAVAGVIGTRKFQYDVWGDTVNTASRMESTGEPGRIQITEATRALLGDAYRCTPRGTIEVKGKGELSTWWLDGPA
ncbi:MAG: adenylate/guanylate cyclase domain-containing protein [Acidimicrobiia bacterium]|nr:adenylate/guanylate cyclase domain-containing protein [Acidimicrobiia bacterium]